MVSCVAVLFNAQRTTVLEVAESSACALFPALCSRHCPRLSCHIDRRDVSSLQAVPRKHNARGESKLSDILIDNSPKPTLPENRLLRGRGYGKRLEPAAIADTSHRRAIFHEELFAKHETYTCVDDNSELAPVTSIILMMQVFNVLNKLTLYFPRLERVENSCGVKVKNILPHQF